MAPKSNFLNIRMAEGDVMLVTGLSSDQREIEAVHVAIGHAPDTAAAASTAGTDATGELVPVESQLTASLDGPMPGEWTIAIQPPHGYRAGEVVVIAGTTLRRDPATRKPLPPDTWVGCSGILSKDQMK